MGSNVFRFLSLGLLFGGCSGFTVSPSSARNVQIQCREPSAVVGSPDITVSSSSTRTTALNAKAKKKKAPASAKSKPSGMGGFGKATGKWDGCEDLRKWLTSRGAEIDPGISVGVVDPVTGLRGVTACKDFKRGDVLFSVPRDTFILDENKADARPFAAVLYPSMMERKTLPPPIRNALQLLWLERTPSARVGWEPFLDSLPSPADFEADGGPMELWSETELAQVECGQLLAEVSRRSKDLRAHYDERILPKWTAAAEDPESELSGVTPPTFGEFQFAVCVVTSRTFGEGEPDAGSSSMMVPGVDMCNHDDPAAVNTKHALAPWGSFVVLAQTGIKNGEQITLTYGAMPNRLLLAQFGFMLLNRKTPLASDTALVRIDGLIEGTPEDVKPATAESEAVADAAWEAGSALTTLINLKGNRGSSGKFSRWQPAPVARAAADMTAEGDAAKGKALYRGLLERELASYSTSLDEDQSRLDSDEALPIRTFWALNFRVESKRMLTKELESLDA